MKAFYSISICALGLVSNGAAGPIQEYVNHLSKRDGGTFQWGAIGDSYASGVAYKDSVLYDNNQGNCLRTTEAYANQLKEDTSWFNGWTEYFTWTACSGSKLVNMQDQIVGVGASPRLVTMTAGGNDGGSSPDAGFFRVVDNCIFHSDLNKDYGLPYNQDNDRTGACAVSIDASKAYIANTIGQDLKNTINDILGKDNVKSQPDFLLYVTGYAQFFNSDPTWCNGHSFADPRAKSRPQLSQYVRNDINELVLGLNTIYEKTIQDFPSVRFINYDASFSGKRFCEADATFWGQYFSSDVWFWNVVPPSLTVSNQQADEPEFDDDLETALGNTPLEIAGSGGGSVSNGWLLRPFHPKIDGHGAIEKAIVAQMKADNIPPSTTSAPVPQSTGSTPPASSTPPSTTSAPVPQSTGSTPPASSTPPAYAKGTCNFHVDEYEDCAADDSDLSANITMYDNDKNVIGQTDQSGNGPAINIKDPLSFTSKLAQPMVVVGEHENDYIQFTIGTLSFKSSDTNMCHVGGWDPRDGPSCRGRQSGPVTAKNQMDCSFPC